MLFILVNLFTSALAGPEFLQAEASATFNTFALEWRPSVCQADPGQCASGYFELNFNIHGLWPSVASGTQPQYCTTSYPFRLNLTMIEHLQKYWNQASSAADITVWEQAWEKYGVCMNPAIPSNTYFADGITLFNQLDAKKLLKDKGIKPSKSELVKKNDFISAFPNTVNIMCFNSSGKSYIEYVFVCYDNSLNPINCTPATTNCGNSFYLPDSYSG